MTKKFILVTMPACPSCPAMKEFMKECGMEGDFVDAATPEGLDVARRYSVKNAPTAIFLEDDKEIGRANSPEEAKKFL